MKKILSRLSNQKTNKQKFFIDSIIVYIATFSDRFTFLIINIIVARYLSVELFGEYTTALGYATFFSTFLNLGINQSLIRAVNLDSGHESEHFTNAFIIRTVLSFFVYGAMVFSLYYTDYNHATIYLIYVFGLVRIINEFMNGLYSYYDAKQMFVNSTFYNISFSVSFLTATVFVVLFKGDYYSFAYSRLVIALFFFIAILFLTLRKINMVFVASKMKEFIKKTIPFVLYSIYGTLQTRLNIILISFVLGTFYTGIFNNAYIFFSTLTFIPGNFNRVIVPFLYRHSKAHNKYQFAFDIGNRFFGVVSFYIALLFLLYSNHIMNLAFGSKYASSGSLLVTFAFGVPFLFNVAWSIIIAIDKQKVNTNIVGISAVLNLVLNIVMMKIWGVKGAALATIITQILVFTLSAIYLKTKKIVTLGYSVISMAKLTVICFICYMIEKYFVSHLFWMIDALIISLIYLILTSIIVLDKKNYKFIAGIVKGQ